MKLLAKIPGIGSVFDDLGLVPLAECSDGHFRAGRDGVISVTATGDRKVEFVAFADHTLAYVKSALGYPAYDPLRAAEFRRPVKAVLMDLDGTTVKSEGFWVGIIEKTVSGLLEDPGFRLEACDLPYVSGHSVSEHLKYCIAKYCPEKTLEEARDRYFRHTHREMGEILKGRGRKDAFTPAPGGREFLLELKAMKVKIGLVTSGLYEKAYPEILSAFETMGLGDPKEFYDAVITAGFPLRKGEAGTLGELSPKPHPWLYAEACRVGLGIGFEERGSVVGIEDSGAGICSIRLAGFPAVGFGGGNIAESGAKALCSRYCETFDDVLRFLT